MRNIDVVFLSSYGKFRGRLQGSGSKHVGLRQRQLQLLSEDEAFGLRLTKAIVAGKIHNQRVVLQRQTRRLQSSPPQAQPDPLMQPANLATFRNAVTQMVQMGQGAERSTHVDVTRGYEGKAAVYYFAAVRELLEPAWGFQKREYYPPPDPFNAALSFAYGLLRKDIEAAIQIVGLDLYVGFFHVVEYGRPSLALDLMEEWRPLVADAMILQLVNRGLLTPRDFRATGQLRRPVELMPAGLNRVLKAYGERLGQKIYHPLAGPGGQTTIRQALTLQARRLARVIRGELAAYEPMRGR